MTNATKGRRDSKHGRRNARNPHPVSQPRDDKARLRAAFCAGYEAGAEDWSKDRGASNRKEARAEEWQIREGERRS